jgi:hypothetical protein
MNQDLIKQLRNLPAGTTIKKKANRVKHVGTRVLWEGQLKADEGALEKIEAPEFKDVVSRLMILARRNGLLDET